ncbi:hypothetical protein RUND412_002990 [Rhizina undulata]
MPFGRLPGIGEEISTWESGDRNVYDRKELPLLVSLKNFKEGFSQEDPRDRWIHYRKTQGRGLQELYQATLLENLENAVGGAENQKSEDVAAVTAREELREGTSSGENLP